MKKNLSLELIKEERKNSRIKKISELVKRAVADTFQTIDFSNSNEDSFLFSISDVSLSKDGKIATIIVSDLNYKNKLEESFYLALIESHINKINKEFSKKIDLRYTPRLRFKVKSFKDLAWDSTPRTSDVKKKWMDFYW